MRTRRGSSRSDLQVTRGGVDMAMVVALVFQSCNRRGVGDIFPVGDQTSPIRANHGYSVRMEAMPVDLYISRVSYLTCEVIDIGRAR